MTKERKLAIKMWKEIRKEILIHHRKANVERLKFRFACLHDINWTKSCWFCHYLRFNHFPSERGCTLCPIAARYARTDSEVNGCGVDSLWYKVIYSSSRLVRVIACTRIIHALRRKY